MEQSGTFTEQSGTFRDIVPAVLVKLVNRVNFAPSQLRNPAMPSPLTREDVRRLLIDVDDQLAAVREWEPEHPYRDQWATALQGLRYRRGKLAARLDRVSAAGRQDAGTTRTGGGC